MRHCEVKLRVTRAAVIINSDVRAVTTLVRAHPAFHLGADASLSSDFCKFELGDVMTEDPSVATGLGAADDLRNTIVVVVHLAALAPVVGADLRHFDALNPEAEENRVDNHCRTHLQFRPNVMSQEEAPSTGASAR